MGKWSMRMDAGLFVWAGALITGPTHAHADAIAVLPPIPIPHRWPKAWSSLTIEAAREGLKPTGTTAGSCGGAHAFAKAASAVAKPIAAGSPALSSTPGGPNEPTARLRLAATF